MADAGRHSCTFCYVQHRCCKQLLSAKENWAHLCQFPFCEAALPAAASSTSAGNSRLLECLPHLWVRLLAGEGFIFMSGSTGSNFYTAVPLRRADAGDLQSEPHLKINMCT